MSKQVLVELSFSVQLLTSNLFIYVFIIYPLINNSHNDVKKK